MVRINGLLTILVLAAGTACAAPVVLITLAPPDGLLAGATGTAVGWGYSITTDSAFVTIQSITFGDLTPIGIFSTPGLPSSAASFGSPISTPWIQDIAGLQYDISFGAILGASTQGVITLTYDAYNDVALTDQIVFGDSVNAQFNGSDAIAAVEVNGVGSVATPEPGTMALLGLGIAAVLWKRRLSPRQANFLASRSSDY